jgi:L-lactate dehydrogenase (cytochrome)
MNTRRFTLLLFFIVYPLAMIRFCVMSQYSPPEVTLKNRHWQFCAPSRGSFDSELERDVFKAIKCIRAQTCVVTGLIGKRLLHNATAHFKRNCIAANRRPRNAATNRGTLPAISLTPGKFTMRVASVIDYRRLAQKRVPHFLFEYLDGGSYAEVTKNRNKADLAAITLRQRVLRGAEDIDTRVSLFGKSYDLPVGLAPVGLAGMFARRGELQAIRAAEKANVPFTLSTVGVCAINEVARAASEPFWFQLYMIRDRALLRDLFVQAKEAGCSVLVFTVDMPVPGSRYRDYRSGLAGESWLSGNLRRVSQALARPRWAWDVGLMGRPHQLGNIAPALGKKSGLNDFMAWMGKNFDPSISWKDLEFVRANWDGPIIIKGILDADGAREAAAAEVDGVVVSNHGGRQLDGVASSANALPRIADAVGDKMTILADGGIYSGLDVLRMLALGADSVLIGRSWVYALAARGQAGIEHVLDLIRSELRVAMTLTGCQRISDIDRSALE